MIVRALSGGGSGGAVEIQSKSVPGNTVPSFTVDKKPDKVIFVTTTWIFMNFNPSTGEVVTSGMYRKQNTATSFEYYNGLSFVITDSSVALSSSISSAAQVFTAILLNNMV